MLVSASTLAAYPTPIWWPLEFRWDSDVEDLGEPLLHDAFLGLVDLDSLLARATFRRPHSFVASLLVVQQILQDLLVRMMRRRAP